MTAPLAAFWRDSGILEPEATRIATAMAPQLAYARGMSVQKLATVFKLNIVQARLIHNRLPAFTGAAQPAMTTRGGKDEAARALRKSRMPTPPLLEPPETVQRLTENTFFEWIAKVGAMPLQETQQAADAAVQQMMADGAPAGPADAGGGQ